MVIRTHMDIFLCARQRCYNTLFHLIPQQPYEVDNINPFGQIHKLNQRKFEDYKA